MGPWGTVDKRPASQPIFYSLEFSTLELQGKDEHSSKCFIRHGVIYKDLPIRD